MFCASSKSFSIRSLGWWFAAGALLLAAPASAAVGQESQFVFNTFSFLIWGA